MRTLPLLLLLALPATAFAADRATPPPSAVTLVRFRPTAWRLPASAMRAGMRFDPETGEAVAPMTRPVGRGATTAALRQAASASVRIRPDGSGHAVLGTAFRSWTVVHVGADGRLVTDCVDDIDAATKRVEETREVPR